MITCPECGQAASDDAKFCDRCGQGLAKSAAPKIDCAIAALEPGTSLRSGEFRLIALIARTALENRYRAERIREGAVIERVQLRERIAPAPVEVTDASGSAPAGTNGKSDEDPSGPRAKTAELRRPPQPLASTAPPPPPPSAQPPVPESSAAPASESHAAVAGVSACEESGAGATVSDRNGDGEGPGETAGRLPTPAGVAAAEGGNNEMAQAPAPARSAAATEPLTLTDAMAEVEPEPAPASAEASAPATTPVTEAAESVSAASAAAASGIAAVTGVTPATPESELGRKQPEVAAAGPEPPRADLGELFERVLALSLTTNHPAFQRAVEGFAEDGRVYLVYPDEQYSVLAQRHGGLKMSEGEALSVAIQVCQAVSFLNRRGLRLNDICPQSVAYAPGGRVKLLGLDYVSNDTELQTEPIFNDGYTAPEIYRGKRVDKRADIFSVGALLYSCLTGERLESESWREEAGPIRFYPPHVVSPELEQVVRRALAFDPQGRWPTVDALKAELVRLSAVVWIRAAALTDVGMVREHNEDSVMAVEYVRQSLLDPAQHCVYVVADGMGGAEAGEVASAIAVDTIRNYLEARLSGAEAENPGQLLSAALEEANRKIIEYQAAHPESRGMGSTAVGALIVPPEAAVAWVGDSRAYLCDQAGLRQVTRDHSLVQRLIEIGQITPEEARHHEHKNVITRSLGARQSGPAGAEAVTLRLKRGDRLMLCSDGLTTHVEDRTIAEVLRRHDDPYAAARELVVAANAGGGTDNVSVIVVFAD
jgi:serine/threonine protein phosphatase PrpC